MTSASMGLDADRIKAAIVVFRRNFRQAFRDSGIPYEASALVVPPAADLFVGVDATPTELLSYMRWQVQDAVSGAQVLQRAASVGMAAEVGMHEVNSEFSHATSLLRGVLERASLGDRDAKAVEASLAAIKRLSEVIGSLARFGRSGYWADVTGKTVFERIDTLMGRGLEHGKVALTTTPEFLNARISGSEAAVVPAFVNLVRNACAWLPREGGERRIHLDATEVDAPPIVLEEEDGTESIHHHKVWIVSVSDSGCGVLDAERENIFRPFRSGRGSSGIGLYLARRSLESSRNALVLSSEPNPLGGACFLVGPISVLEPAPSSPLDRRERLLMAAVGIVQLLVDGRGDEVLRTGEDDWAEVCRETLRIRVRGAVDGTDVKLKEAAEFAQALLEARAPPEPVPAWLQEVGVVCATIAASDL